MSNMVRSNYANIEVLMNNSNKNLNSTSSSNDEFNIDQILPVKSESELKALEDNLKVVDFKISLVHFKHFSMKKTFLNLNFYIITVTFFSGYQIVCLNR